MANSRDSLLKRAEGNLTPKEMQELIALDALSEREREMNEDKPSGEKTVKLLTEEEAHKYYLLMKKVV